MSIKMSLNPDLARQFVGIIGAVSDEFRLKIGPDGWNVAVVDPANVAMIRVNLPKDNFKNYEFVDTGVYTSSIDYHPTGIQDDILKVGVDVEKFIGDDVYEHLHRVPPEAVRMLPEEQAAPVEFTFSKAPDKYGGRYQVELKQSMFKRRILLLAENSLRKEPSISSTFQDYELTLGTLELRRTVEKAAKISDYISLGYRRDDTDTVFFTANAPDEDDFPLDIEKQVYGFKSLKENSQDSARSLFSLDYLADIVTKISCCTNPVRLQIGQDVPLKLIFGIGRNGTVEYMQAPRIESE